MTKKEFIKRLFDIADVTVDYDQEHKLMTFTFNNLKATYSFGTPDEPMVYMPTESESGIEALFDEPVVADTEDVEAMEWNKWCCY